MSALVSFERVFEVLDLKPLITEKPDAVDLARQPASVEFVDVHFAYPGADEVSLASLEDVAIPDHSPRHPVLHGVSFRADAGRLVALVGPSGAGKTTISQLVPRVYDVDSGAVRVGGIDVRDLTLQSLRDRIGVVAQDAHLFHDTIRANLLYARPDATEEELIEALRAAQIWDLVSGLPQGLDTVVGDRGLPAVRRREAAARDRQGAAQGAGDRHPRRGDRTPGQRVGGARCSARLRPRCRAAPRW